MAKGRGEAGLSGGQELLVDEVTDLHSLTIRRRRPRSGTAVRRHRGLWR